VKQSDYKTAADYLNALNNYFRLNILRVYLNFTAELEYNFGYDIDDFLIRYLKIKLFEVKKTRFCTFVKFNLAVDF
jgi:hypothetical protein